MLLSNLQPANKIGFSQVLCEKGKSIQLLCLLLFFQIVPYTAQDTSSGDIKAVFKPPCKQTMRLKTSIPFLTEFTVCTYINVTASNFWRAFTYTLPSSTTRELELFGDNKGINIWIFNTYINFIMILAHNEWHETCISWHGKNQSFEFFINGQLVVSHNLQNRTELTGGGTLYLGCPQEKNPSTPASFHGELYMFRMWNRADSSLVQKCTDGNVIRWNMSDWDYQAEGTIERDLSLRCDLATTERRILEIENESEYLCRVEFVQGWKQPNYKATSVPLDMPSGTSAPNMTTDSTNVSVTSTSGRETTATIIKSTINVSVTTHFSSSSRVTTNIVSSSSDVATLYSTITEVNSTPDGNECQPNNSSLSVSVVECLHFSLCNHSEIYEIELVGNETVCSNLQEFFMNTSEATTSEATTSDATTSDATTSDAITSDAITIEATTSEATTPEATTVEAITISKIPDHTLKSTLDSSGTSEISHVTNGTIISILSPSTSITLETTAVMQTESTSENVPTDFTTRITLDLTSKAQSENKSCTFMVEKKPNDTICSIVQNIKSMNYTVREIKRIESCCCFPKKECPSNFTAFNSSICDFTEILQPCGSGSNVGSTSGGSNHPPRTTTKTTKTTITTNTSSDNQNNLDKTVERLKRLLASNPNSSVVDYAVKEIEKLLIGDVNAEDAEKLVRLVDTFFNLSQELITPVAKRLILIVDTIGLKVIFSGSSLNITSNSLALATNKVKATAFSETSFGVETSNGLQVSLGSQGSPNSDGTIILPASLLSGLTVDEKANASRVQFNFYNKTAFFVDSSIEAKKRTLVSRVISSSVGNLTISDLTENVTVILKITSEDNNAVHCVFWDFTQNNGSGGWQSDGCILVNRTQDEVECKCNHLTSFSILMDVSGKSLDPEDLLRLTFISYIGCGISAIFLSVTIVTYIAFEKIRRDYPSKILIQLCAALVGLNLSFLLSPWISLYDDIPGLCIAAGAFLHYFVLVSITWTALEAIHMYLSLVKVFNTYVRRYMLKFCIIGWGCPAVIVAIILAANKAMYEKQTKGNYPDGSVNEICWINDIIFYTTVVGYFGIVFLLNVSMFIVVLIQLCRIKKQKQVGYQRKTTFQDLRSVAGITFLLGITWGLGFFSWGPGHTVISYIFAILNSLQGFFIFVFYCLAKENVRKQWRRYLCCGKLKLAENSDWSKTNTNKLKMQTSKQGVSSNSSHSIQSNTNSNSTALLVTSDYVHPNGNGNVFKERNGGSIMGPNAEVPLYDISIVNFHGNGNAQRATIRRTSNKGVVHFMEQT